MKDFLLFLSVVAVLAVLILGGFSALHQVTETHKASAANTTAPSQSPSPGYLGVLFEQASQQQVEGLGYESAVVVTRLVARGPAELAGVRRGDLIVKVDNTPVTSPVVMQAIGSDFKPNQVVQVHVIRTDEEGKQTRKLKIDVRPIALEQYIPLLNEMP
jgi:S1-C subfamily serine protease